MNIISRYIDSSINIRRSERSALVLSFAYFFCLLCAYYIIRPLRDEMGILGGIDNLPWVFTGTFLVILAMVPLYGWVSSRFARRQFLPLVYIFFISNLFIFYFLFSFDIAATAIAQVFFIWASVFNLFVVSVFWSFMNDIFDKDQAKRLFGVIAAGGTSGAICGPIITTWLVEPIGINNLLLICIGFIALALFFIRGLSNWSEKHSQQILETSYKKPISGNWFSGITLVFRSPYLLGICILILMYSSLSTFLYFQQASIIKASFTSSAERTSIFAMIDMFVNILTLLIQVFLTSRIVKTLGLNWTLTLIPLLLIAGFIALSILPILGIIILVQILRRAGNYAIMKPAREMLYTVLGREEKYKAKNFIDTVVYRGGDAVSAWAYDGLIMVGFNLAQIAFIAAPLSAVWAYVAYQLGVKREQIANSKQNNTDQQE